jgi:hypothetical protein
MVRLQITHHSCSSIEFKIKKEKEMLFITEPWVCGIGDYAVV